MPLPGFSAEASLGPASRRYAAAANQFGVRRQNELSLQQDGVITPWGWGGDDWTPGGWPVWLKPGTIGVGAKGIVEIVPKIVIKLPPPPPAWAAIGFWLAVDIAAIAWAAHDIGKAISGPAQQPPVKPAGCSPGTYTIPGTVTGWSVPFKYPGCAGAWDHAQVNAQAICDANLPCTGTCPDGTPCKPIAILADRVDETRYLVTCQAEGSYVCQCGC
ncbi:MAG TPA: hypothetical protein VKB71_10460 [Rhizomicrobium sp.]|nr:hypothetical protein [Rhizomicrobium sp.]